MVSDFSAQTPGGARRSITSRTALRLAAAFLAATLVAAILGSVVQTQFNLRAIAALGAEIPPKLWAATIAQDLARFGPVMAAIAAAAFLPAFAAAALAARLAPGLRSIVYAVAGLVGLAVAFWAMGFVSPMPTLVAAVRGTAGYAAMSATGLAGGLVFALMTRTGPLNARR